MASDGSSFGGGASGVSGYGSSGGGVSDSFGGGTSSGAGSGGNAGSGAGNRGFDFGPGGSGRGSRGSRGSGRRSVTEKRHPVLKFLGVVVGLIIALFAGALIYVNVIMGNMSANDPELSAALSKVEGQQPYYTLLLGSDAREGQDESECRTDVIILARVDPKTATATLVSVPRDTLVYIDGYGPNKINSAYTFGGAAGAVNAVENLTGVSVSHYAEVNFGNLESLIDAMGGVQVNVEEPINDPKAGKFTIDAGEQTLNGEQALVFARSRAYANGDFTRGNNQKILVNAIVDKMLSLDATAMPGVLMECSKCVTTDYSFNELLALVMTFQTAKNGGVASGVEVDNPIDAIATVIGAITGSNGLSLTTALQLVWDYIMGATDSGEKPTEVTMYTATVPSAAQSIGGVSYVVADTTALAEMMQLVNAGDDPKKTTINSEESGWLGDGYNVDDAYQPTYDLSPLNMTDQTTSGDAGDYYGYDDGSGDGYADGSGGGYADASGGGTDGGYADSSGYADSGYSDGSSQG